MSLIIAALVIVIAVLIFRNRGAETDNFAREFSESFGSIFTKEGFESFKSDFKHIGATYWKALKQIGRATKLALLWLSLPLLAILAVILLIASACAESFSK